MIPAELTPTVIDLPPAERCTIVVLTGQALRHDRLALRLQAEFPGLLAAWIQVARARPARPATGAGLAGRLRRALAARLVGAFEPRSETQAQAEERLFGEEIAELRKSAYVSPVVVTDPNAREIIELVKSFDPYFIITLGGAIYGKELCTCARGLALNQHDGWCPEFRGSYTVNWALYYRDLAKVASTVHVLTPGMDSGPILRRSSACLAQDDTPESCFARSVALGTELICETVRELIETRRARIYPQPQLQGRTFLRRELTEDIRRDIRRDLRAGLIGRDIVRRRKY